VDAVTAASLTAASQPAAPRSIAAARENALLELDALRAMIAGDKKAMERVAAAAGPAGTEDDAATKVPGRGAISAADVLLDSAFAHHATC